MWSPHISCWQKVFPRFQKLPSNFVRFFLLPCRSLSAWIKPHLSVAPNTTWYLFLHRRKLIIQWDMVTIIRYEIWFKGEHDPKTFNFSFLRDVQDVLFPNSWYSLCLSRWWFNIRSLHNKTTRTIKHYHHVINVSCVGSQTHKKVQRLTKEEGQEHRQKTRKTGCSINSRPKSLIVEHSIMTFSHL